MKIDAMTLKRIIKEELVYLNENPEGESKGSAANFTDSNAKNTARMGEKNRQMQTNAEKAAEKGPRVLAQNIKADLQKYKADKKDIIQALKLVLQGISQGPDESNR